MKLPFIDDDPLSEPRSRFSMPPWDRYMGPEADHASIGEIAPMLRYLYAKIEMLEEKVARLEAK